MVSPRYAVICAPHSGNSGMHSVDRAARQFFSRHEADHTLFVAQKRHAKHLVEYELLSGLSELDDYTHVLYWGDFLNNPVYGYTSFPSRSMKYGLVERKSQAIRQWKRLFVPDPQWAEGKTVLSLGSNFQHDFTSRPDKYPPVLKTLERSFTGFHVRDPFSHQNLSRSFSFRGMRKVELGLDCAFLQDPEPPAEEGTRGNFAYFLHRSQLKDPEGLISSIEYATGMQGVNLGSWLSLERGRWERMFSEMKAEIGAAAFVVSDTYHVCVNALHSQTPVLGIGRFSQEQSGTLGDLKKRTLFEQFAVEDHYHELGIHEPEEELTAGVLARLNEVLRKHRDGTDPYYMVQARMRQFSARMERILGLA